MTPSTPPLHPGWWLPGLRCADAWQRITAGALGSGHGIPQRLTLGLLLVLLLVVGVLPAMASPGLCVGPVCGDEFSRSAQYHWQLRLRVNDQQGHRERLVVDCRSGTLSPQQGQVERSYAGAVARRACRLVGEGNG